MTAELDRGLAALKTEFKAEISAGLITHLGTTNCRRKNNTENGPWSEHAWPNAVDVMLKRIPGTASPTAEAKAVGHRVAKWMRAHPELWSEVFWQVAAHFDHVHGTATPRRNYDNKQVPPCAGGPADPPGDDEMTLKRGDSGNAVNFFQNCLNTWRPETGLVVGSPFDAKMETAVKSYQGASDLPQTGEIDGITATLLAEYREDKADPPPGGGGLNEAQVKAIVNQAVVRVD